MAGVTSSGFEIPTFDEIVQDLRDLANTPEYFGSEFPTTPDSNFYILASIFAAGLKDSWDNTQAVAAQANRDEAEGKWLDDLAALIGITRLNAASATGSLVFTSTDNVVIPIATPIRFTSSKEVVLTESQVTASINSCYRTVVNIPSLLIGSTYLIRIDGAIYSHLSTPSDTITSIRDSLVTNINNGVQGLIATPLDTDSLQIQSGDYTNSITVNDIQNMNITTVDTIVQTYSSFVGEINFYSGQLVSLVGNISGVSSVVNEVDWSTGRNVETDEELRKRMDEKEETTGTATKPAIESSVGNIEGVISTLLIENVTDTTDVDGRPPKSYELYVEGGSDTDIANEIWRTKPAGISTYGTVSVTITDQNGDEQVVNFSRFETKYGWVRVGYQINSEEDFPSDAEDLIRTTVVNTGNNFYRGEDLEVTKFYGDLYTNVEGIYVGSVTTDITDNPTDTPTYTSNRKSVANTVKLLFAYDRTEAYLQ